MNLLIIGGGAVSEKFHIPAAISLLSVDNVYLAEPNGNQATKLSNMFNLQHVVTDYKSVLRNVDAVVIATPPHIHAEIMISCIEAGVPVLCEKPVTLTHEEALVVSKANSTKNVLIGMCHTYRLFPGRIYAKQRIEEGFFGENLNIDIQEGAPADWPTVSGYCYRKDLVPGGVLFDAGIHSLDFILWCLGTPSKVEYLDDSIGGLESNASMKLTFDANKTATFRISRTCELSNKITISGSENSIELDIFEMDKLKNLNTPTEIQNVKNDSGKAFDWTTIGQFQLQDFIDSVEGKKSLFCTFEDGVKAVELIENCYAQKKERPFPLKATIPGIRF